MHDPHVLYVVQYREWQLLEQYRQRVLQEPTRRYRAPVIHERELPPIAQTRHIRPFWSLHRRQLPHEYCPQDFISVLHIKTLAASALKSNLRWISLYRQ